MIFEFLSNFYLTNNIHEFTKYDTKTKIDLRNKYDHLPVLYNAFLNFEVIIVYYNDVNKLKSFIRSFLNDCAGGRYYERDLDQIIDMNLGLKSKNE